MPVPVTSVRPAFVCTITVLNQNVCVYLSMYCLSEDVRSQAGRLTWTKFSCLHAMYCQFRDPVCISNIRIVLRRQVSSLSPVYRYLWVTTPWLFLRSVISGGGSVESNLVDSRDPLISLVSGKGSIQNWYVYFLYLKFSRRFRDLFLHM